MKNFTTFYDCSPAEIAQLVARAQEIKGGSAVSALADKHLGMVFFNPSLRTRVSFETAMKRNRGFATSLSPGADMWSVEYREGAVMNGNKVEHIKDSVKVLSRFCDALAVRSFSQLTSYEEDKSEEILSSFLKYSDVPVISMESCFEHPCQALADMVTIRERFRNPNKKRFVLTWAPHLKPLPLAVPHSALLAGAYSGMEVVLAHPEGFNLDPDYLSHARKTAESLGGSLSITHDQISALKDADVVYAKAWGMTENLFDSTSAGAPYGNTEHFSHRISSLENWKFPLEALREDSLFLHCLPVRRNVEVADEVLNSSHSKIYDEAENRLWAQTAVLESLFS